MEKDGISRVYVTTGGEPYARELFPERQEPEDALKDGPASAVLQRADFRGVYHWRGIYAKKPGTKARTEFEGYGFRDPVSGDYFDISTQEAGTQTPSEYQVVVGLL